MSDRLKIAVKKLSAEKQIIVCYYWNLIALMNSTNCNNEAVLDEFVQIQDKYPNLKNYFNLDKWY